MHFGNHYNSYISTPQPSFDFGIIPSTGIVATASGVARGGAGAAAGSAVGGADGDFGFDKRQGQVAAVSGGFKSAIRLKFRLDVTDEVVKVKVGVSVKIEYNCFVVKLGTIQFGHEILDS